MCSIDESVWDAVDVGWTRLEGAKSTRDKAALAATNANSKALNAVFLCCISRRVSQDISCHNCQGGMANIGDHV